MPEPFDEVAVDLIGPWSFKLNNQVIQFQALTCIDPVTTLAEIVRIDNKTSAHVSNRFENSYLARYPRPLRCIHDNGGEFVGPEFQHVLVMNGIKDVPTTVMNPQANAICERLHQTIGNVLRTLLLSNPPQNLNQADELIESSLATAMYASRATIHSTLNLAPGAIAFHRDMVLPIPLQADFALMRDRRQVVIDENLRRQNMRRYNHDYTVGDEILIVNRDPNRPKLVTTTAGPFPIAQVHSNGTVTFIRSPNVYERINIRRIRPFNRHGGGE